VEDKEHVGTPKLVEDGSITGELEALFNEQ